MWIELKKRLFNCSKVSNSNSDSVSILDYCVVMPLFLTLSLKKDLAWKVKKTLNFLG
jgi:hypothetical protein